MLPYFLLIIIPFLSYFIVIKKVNNKNAVMLGIGVHNETSNMALPIFFLMLLVLLACRSELVGNDTGNYHYIFDKSAGVTIAEIFSEGEEFLFALLNYGLYRISDNYQLYLAVIAILEVIPIMYLYCRDRRHSFLKIALYVNMSTFIMMFSGIRQMIAIGLGVLAYECLRNNRKWLFWLLAIIAMFVHISGFMVIALFPLFYLRLKKKHLLIIIPVILTVFVFNKQLFGVLASTLGLFTDRFEIVTTSTGAFFSLLLFVIFAIFSYVVSDETQMTDEDFALRNILLMAVVIQCFASLHSLAMRMNYYFIIFVPLAVASTLEKPQKKLENVAHLGEIVMIIFFVLYFIYTVFTEYISGVSALNTVPYVPFWAIE